MHRYYDMTVEPAPTLGHSGARLELSTPWVEPRQNSMRTMPFDLASRSSLILTGAAGVGKSRLLMEIGRQISGSLEQCRSPAISAVPRSDLWRALSLKTIDLAHWETIWRCVISCSILTHINEHRRQLEKEDRKRLRRAVKDLPAELFRSKAAQHPFAIIRVLAHRNYGNQDTVKTKYFESHMWQIAEDTARSLVQQVPPLLLEIDHIDEYFGVDPTTIAEAQCGLALYLVHLEREPFPNRMVTIHAALRSSTRAFTMLHRGVDLAESSAFVEILWTKSSLAKLMLASASANNVSKSQANNLAHIFPKDRIPVPQRQTVEHLHEYIMRHTTLSPADVMTIAKRLVRRADYLERPLLETELRAEIHDACVVLIESRIVKIVGDLQALGWPKAEQRMPLAGISIQRDELVSRLTTLLSSVGSERISRTQLLQLAEQWEELSRPFLINTLWVGRLILIAAVDSGVRRVAGSILDHLSVDEQMLALHPMLHDISQIVASQEEVILEYY
jgi:hypothetical protein